MNKKIDTYSERLESELIKAEYLFWVNYPFDVGAKLSLQDWTPRGQLVKGTAKFNDGCSYIFQNVCADLGTHWKYTDTLR